MSKKRNITFKKNNLKIEFSSIMLKEYKSLTEKLKQKRILDKINLGRSNERRRKISIIC